MQTGSQCPGGQNCGTTWVGMAEGCGPDSLDGSRIDPETFSHQGMNGKDRSCVFGYAKILQQLGQLVRQGRIRPWFYLQADILHRSITCQDGRHPKRVQPGSRRTVYGRVCAWASLATRVAGSGNRNASLGRIVPAGACHWSYRNFCRACRPHYLIRPRQPKNGREACARRAVP